METPSPIKPPLNWKKGSCFILVSWIFFTAVIALARTASTQSSIPTVLLFQNLISLVIMLPWMIQKGGKSLHLSKIGVIMIRSLAGFLTYAFMFLAVQRISLVSVVLLSNTAPFFIPLIIWGWKGVKIHGALWAGILIGFIGVALILRPNHELFNLGSLFGLGSALCFSISMIAQRRLVKTEPVYTVLFYYFLISTILSIPFAVETWKPLNLQTVFLLASIGGLFVLGQFFFLSGFKYEKPSFLSSFNYISVVYGALIEWIFWGQFPDWLTILGIFIVCIGGIITVHSME